MFRILYWRKAKIKNKSFRLCDTHVNKIIISPIQGIILFCAYLVLGGVHP